MQLPDLRRRWVIVVAVLVLVGLVGWWLFPEDEPEPAPVEEGAYTYDTSGFEEVDILGGARHEYPATTGISVERTACGHSYSWQPLRARRDTYEICGGRLRSFSELHEFFGNRDERTYRCTARSSLRRGWRCSYENTTEVARGGAIGTERIGGIETVHIHLETRISGDTEGAGTRDFWLRRSDDFPVGLAATNENTTASAVGPVTYRERYELRLRTPGAAAGGTAEGR